MSDCPDLIEGAAAAVHAGKPVGKCPHSSHWPDQARDEGSDCLTSCKLSSLPDGVVCLSNLQQLSIMRNALSELPDQLTDLVNLQSLDISINQISELPANIGALSKLETLKTVDNAYTSLCQSVSWSTCRS